MRTRHSSFLLIFLFWLLSPQKARATEPQEWPAVMDGPNAPLLENPDYLTEIVSKITVYPAPLDFRQHPPKQKKEGILDPLLSPLSGRFRTEPAENLLRPLRSDGLPLVPYAQIKTLESFLDAITQKYFGPDFGPLLGKIQYVILNKESQHAWIYPDFRKSRHLPSALTVQGKRIRQQLMQTPDSVIVLSSGMLRAVRSLDELVGLIGHELFHLFRNKMVEESHFDSFMRGLNEEELVDASSAKLLLKNGLNPLGMSRLLETLEREHAKDPYGMTIASFGSSHPPTEIRITRINALIEKWADRQSFPPITPLPSEITQYTAQPPASLSPMRRALRVLFASEYPFFNQFKQLTYPVAVLTIRDHYGLGRADRPLTQGQILQYFEKVLPDLRAELNYLIEQIGAKGIRRFAELHHITPERVARKILDSFETLYDEGFTSIADLRNSKSAAATGDELIRFLAREYRPFQSLFQEMEGKLIARLQKIDSTLRSRGERGHAAMAAFVKTRTWQDLQAWSNAHSVKPADMGQAIFIDSAAIPGVLDHYFRIAPILRDALDQTGWEGTTRKTVKAIKQFYLSALFIRKLNVENPSRLAHELGARVTRLSLSDLEKVALFEDTHINRREKTSTFRFWQQRTERPDDFRRFDWDLTKLTRFHAEEGTPLFLSSTSSVHFESWSTEALSHFNLTRQDVDEILATDIYWTSGILKRVSTWIESLRALDRRIDEGLSENRPRLRELALRALFYGPGGVIAWTQDFRDWRRTKERKSDLKAELSERVTKRLDGTFYDRHEYKTDLARMQKNQIVLFDGLRKTGQTPSTLKDEFDLWKKFTLRGVTDFTDEWAEKLLDRALFEENQIQIQMVKSLFSSQLIWDLRVRERLGRILFTLDQMPLLKKALQHLNQNRREYLQNIAAEIQKFFPENSQEKFNLLNQVANTIQTDREETQLLHRLLGADDIAESNNYGSLEITDGQAIGSRAITQFFSELQRHSLEDRLAVLDFFLGKRDEIPRVLTPEWKSQTYYSDRASQYVIAVVGPYRARRLFQALDARSRAVLLDPLLLGQRGILAEPAGRDWVIQTLVPPTATWKQLAVDLSDGYVQALEKLGQSHLKTLFISYLVSSSVRNSRGKYHELLYGPQTLSVHQHVDSAEREAGKILRRLFEANAALTKLGQRLHSSHVFNEEINAEIASIKDQATPIGREEYYHWLEDAARCDEICKIVRLLDVKGSASVKVVMGASIRGKPAVIHLVRPNAFRRGENSFELVEHALRYALEKGHTSLRVVLPMLERAHQTFKKEIDLTQERASLDKMRQTYLSEKTYGSGFRFTTPKLLDEFDRLIKPENAEAVEAIPVRKFSELTPTEKSEIARAVSEKEAEILLDPNHLHTVHFDKDRHEGNFLIVADPEISAKFGVAPGKLILVIDPGQMSEITPEKRESVLRGLALVAAVLFEVGERSRVILEIRNWMEADLIHSKNLDQTQRIALLKTIETRLHEALAAGKTSPGEVLAFLMAYVEADGHAIDASIWDYLTAFSTNQTWGRYLETSGGGNPFAERALERMNSKAECEEILKPAAEGNPK